MKLILWTSKLCIKRPHSHLLPLSHAPCLLTVTVDLISVQSPASAPHCAVPCLHKASVDSYPRPIHRRPSVWPASLFLKHSFLSFHDCCSARHFDLFFFIWLLYSVQTRDCMARTGSLLPFFHILVCTVPVTWAQLPSLTAVYSMLQDHLK